MNIFSISVAAVCISLVALCIKSVKSDIGQMISIGATILIAITLIPYISEIISAIKELSTYSKMGEKYMQPILKITAIAYISQIGAQLCKDSGEGTLGEKVETAGKIIISVTAIPIAREAFVKIIGILR